MIAMITGVPGQSKWYAVQIAAVENQSDASSRAEELKKQGLSAYLVQTRIEGRGVWYRIRIGRFKTQAEARSAAEKYKNSGLISDFFIAVYEPPSEEFAGESRSGANQRDRAVSPPADSPGRTRRTADDSGGARISETIKPVPAPEEAAPTQQPAGGDKPLPIEVPLKPAGPPNAPPDIEIKNPNWRAYAWQKMIKTNLRSIYFADSLTGWVAGDGGVAFRTTDGGMNWKSMTTGTSANLRQIRFLDWNVGWIVGGSEPDDSDSKNVILLTDDGGNTWRKSKLPFVTGLLFIDKSTGWAFGRNATLLKTTDGGEQWEEVSDFEKIIGLPVESTTYSFGFTEIFFIDAEHGWLVGNFYGEDRNNIGGLFATTDGGKSWKRISVTLDTRYSSGRFTPGLLYSVRFTDFKKGLLTGEMADGEGRFFFVLHTDDGGETWHQNRARSTEPLCTVFVDQQNGWFASYDMRDTDTNAFESTVMKTDNGGLSWQKELFAIGRRIRHLHFTSPQLGWAVGDLGLIIKYENRK